MRGDGGVGAGALGGGGLLYRHETRRGEHLEVTTEVAVGQAQGALEVRLRCVKSAVRASARSAMMPRRERWWTTSSRSWSWSSSFKSARFLPPGEGGRSSSDRDPKDPDD